MRVKADGGVVLAGVVLFAAVAVFGAAATHAAMGIRGGVLLPSLSQSAEAAQPAVAEAPALASAEAGLAVPAVTPTTGVTPSPDARVSSEVLSMAVERAPFDPGRQPPARRYLLPDQIEPPRREQPPPQRPAPPQVRVLGTVVAPAGNVAVVQLADGKKRVMTVGQEMEGYRVAAIESGAVVMSGRGWDLTFAVADAQPIGPNRPQRDANGRIVQRDRAQQNRGQQNQGAQARAQNANNTRAVPLERFLFGGEVQVDMMNNGRAVIMGPDGERREIAIPLPPSSMPITPEMIFFRRPAPEGGGG
jgi:hypothetical protein